MDFVTEGFYPAFGASCYPDWKCDSDKYNLLSSSVDHQINTWKSSLKFNYNTLMKGKGRTVYEWGIAGNTTKAYAMVAMAREMRQAGVQVAAFFQYDTRSSAKLNGIYNDDMIEPEAYNIHFFNLYHTPSQAIDFFAARKTFWNVPLFGQYLAPADDQWAWSTFSSYRSNFSVASDGWSYAQSRATTDNNPTEWYNLTDLNDIITCVGNCRYWNYNGTGAVRLTITGSTATSKTATLTVCPDVIRLRNELYAPSTNKTQNITQLSSGNSRRLTFQNGFANNQTVTITVPSTCSSVKTITW